MDVANLIWFLFGTAVGTTSTILLTLRVITFYRTALKDSLDQCKDVSMRLDRTLARERSLERFIARDVFLVLREMEGGNELLDGLRERLGDIRIRQPEP